MSATPDCESLLRLIPDLPLIRSEGRQYPVDKFYRPLRSGNRFLPVPEETIGEALAESGGDVLIFLPGEAEIRRWQGVLSRSPALSRFSVDVLPLYGRMPLEEQNRVISPSRSGIRRRIILSTDIAETSLTIPGITAVVDTGLTRRPQYNPSSGLTLLSTEEISLASAEQAGGAGPDGPLRVSATASGIRGRRGAGIIRPRRRSCRRTWLLLFWSWPDGDVPIPGSGDG